MVPPTPPKPPVVTQDSRSPLRRGLDALQNTWRQSGMGNFLPSPGDVGRGALSFLFPTVMGQQSRGERITPASFLGDAALAFAPMGLPARAARPALETAEAINARRGAIERLLNKEGPDALSVYLDYPKMGYRNETANVLNRFFKETPERIPAGTQMYRAPSAGQVRPRQGSQSVPLPREIGAEWRPGRIQSTGASQDLQKLGRVLSGEAPTGGSQQYAPGMVAIEAMEDLPGIYDLNAYFNAINARGLNMIPNESTFARESILGPQTRFVVRDFRPTGSEGFPTWFLNAYAR